MGDLKAAVDSGLNVSNNYLYKRALETVDQSLMHMSHPKVQRRFNFNKSEEQIQTYQSQLQRLQEFKNILDAYSN